MTVSVRRPTRPDCQLRTRLALSHMSGTFQTVRFREQAFCPVEAPSPRRCGTSTLRETFRGNRAMRDLTGWNARDHKGSDSALRAKKNVCAKKSRGCSSASRIGEASPCAMVDSIICLWAQLFSRSSSCFGSEIIAQGPWNSRNSRNSQ